MSKPQSPQEALESVKKEFTDLSVQGDLVRQQLELLSNVATEYALAKTAMEEIKKCEGKGEALIPIGAGNFINVELKCVKTVVESIGSEVFVEKSIDAVISEIEDRIRKTREQIGILQSQFIQISTRLQQLQGMGDQLQDQLEASGQA